MSVLHQSGPISQSAQNSNQARLRRGPKNLRRAEQLESRAVFNCDGDGTAPSAALTADANGDGQVDLGDFIQLRNAFGSGRAAGRKEGDYSGDQRADLQDFILLRNSFGQDLDGCQYTFPDLSSYADLADGQLAILRQLPLGTSVVETNDPFLGKTFTTAESPFGLIEYYPDGSARSLTYTTTDGYFEKRYYRQGSSFSPASAQLWYIYNFDREKGVYRTTYLNEDNRVVREVYENGQETRIEFWPNGRIKANQTWQNGAILRTEYFNEQTQLIAQTNNLTGTLNTFRYPPEGRRLAFQLIVNPRSAANAPQVSLYDEYQRAYLLGNLGGRWELREYLKQEAGSLLKRREQRWIGRRLEETAVYNDLGEQIYSIWNPDVVTTRPFGRDARGLAILPSSDEYLGILNLLADQGLAEVPYVPQYQHYLWGEAVTLNRNELRREFPDESRWSSHFLELVNNFRRFNPHLALGTSYSYRVVTPEEANDPATFPLFAIPMEAVPNPDFYRVEATSGLRFIDFNNAAAKEWVAQHLLEVGLGNQEHAVLDHLYLDGVGVTPTWRGQVEVMTGLRNQLNARGIGLHLNIGGYGFLRTDSGGLGVSDDLVADFNQMADVVRLEAPWRLGTGRELNQRTAESTRAIIENMRRLLDTGTAVELLSDTFMEEFIAKNQANPTTVSRGVVSIRETTVDYQGKPTQALLVTTDGPHRIFPTPGNETDQISLINLPTPFAAWEKTTSALGTARNTFLPVATAQPNQVILIKTGPNKQLPVFGADLEQAGGAQLFDSRQTLRTMAAFAMIVRNPGHKLGVLTGTLKKEQPGGGSETSPDNWNVWPRNLGRPTGDFQMDVSSGLIQRLWRDFEHGRVTLFAQEGYSEVVFTSGPAAPRPAPFFAESSPSAVVAAAIDAVLGSTRANEERPLQWQ